MRIYLKTLIVLLLIFISFLVLIVSSGCNGLQNLQLEKLSWQNVGEEAVESVIQAQEEEKVMVLTKTIDSKEVKE